MNRRRTWESIEFQVSRTESNAFYIALLKRRLSVVFNIHHSLDQVKERKGSESNDPTQRIASLFFLSPLRGGGWMDQLSVPHVNFRKHPKQQSHSRIVVVTSSLLTARIESSPSSKGPSIPLLPPRMEIPIHRMFSPTMENWEGSEESSP